MSAINATRKEFFVLFKDETPVNFFQHEPPANKPTQPLLPDGLSDEDIAMLAEWRANSDSEYYYGYYGTSHISAKQARYNTLSGPAKSKADALTAYDKESRSWRVTDAIARMSQWAWLRADGAISNYQTKPISGSTTAVGADPPSSPQVKQEP